MEIIETNEDEDFTELNRNIEAREEINEAAKEFYSGGTPTETIEIVGMPSHIYPGDHTQIHEVRNTDFGKWIQEAVHKTSDEGRFPEALLHYASQIKGGDVFDSGTEAYLLQVAAEVYKNRFDDALVEKGRRQILELAGKLKVTRRNK